MSSTRLAGHAIQNAGGPHDVAGNKIVKRYGNSHWYSTDGPGYAFCECGERSEELLPSRRKRRAWHLAHKVAEGLQVPVTATPCTCLRTDVGTIAIPDPDCPARDIHERDSR